jgi:hypothetical protein
MSARPAMASASITRPGNKTRWLRHWLSGEVGYVLKINRPRAIPVQGTSKTARSERSRIRSWTRHFCETGGSLQRFSRLDHSAGHRSLGAAGGANGDERGARAISRGPLIAVAG